MLTTERAKITNCSAFSKLKSSKSPYKKSPLKSPTKKSKENDENASPSKQASNSYMSPVKGLSSPQKSSQKDCQDSLKETRNSQRRRQKTQEDENLSRVYLEDSN